jgi:hypothetical protein
MGGEEEAKDWGSFGKGGGTGKGEQEMKTNEVSGREMKKVLEQEKRISCVRHSWQME